MDCFTDEKWMKLIYVKKASLLFSCQVVSNSLQLHWLWHTRPSVPYHLPEFAQVHVHCIGDWSSHLILWHPLLLLPSILPNIRDFSNESSVCVNWPKYWNYSFSISPSREYSGLISFRIDYFDLFTVQETLKHLLQHHSLKASILWCLAFFTVQL